MKKLFNELIDGNLKIVTTLQKVKKKKRVFEYCPLGYISRAGIINHFLALLWALLEGVYYSREAIL